MPEEQVGMEKKTLYTVLIIGGVILILAIIVSAVIIMNRNAEGDNQSTPEDTTEEVSPEKYQDEAQDEREEEVGSDSTSSEAPLPAALNPEIEDLAAAAEDQPEAAEVLQNSVTESSDEIVEDVQAPEPAEWTRVNPPKVNQ